MKLKIIRQLFTMSKYLLYALCIQVFCSSMLLANEGMSQKSIYEMKLSVDFDKQHLGEVISTLHKKTGFNFTYNHLVIDTKKKVTYSCNDKPLAEVLEVLSYEMNLGFKRINNNIYIKSVKKNKHEQDSYTVIEVVQQKVSGVVISSDDGQPLPGVSILIVGTTTGTTTDIDGKYSLEIPSGTKLRFSYIGFIPQDIDVGSQTEINVTLASDLEQLDEVVVVGYGTQKKETVTGSVTSVSGEEIERVPTTNLSNAFAGRLPGVFTSQSSGEPGYDGSAIRIRGTNTLGNTDALVVIDGVPGRAGGLDRLNPQDIESVSVLKDAAAAIYGSRAANGVILITTKRGTTGKPKFSYNFNQGWQQPTKLPELLDATQYAIARNELGLYKNVNKNDWNSEWNNYKNGQDVSWNPFTLEDIELYQNGSDPWGHPNTDWYGATMKNWAPLTKHSIQVNGGTENVKYLASIGYQNQDGYYKNSATGYKQYDFRLNLDTKFNEYVSMDFGVVGRNERREFPTESADAIFRMLMRGKPGDPAYWPNGLPGPDIENGQNPVVITTNDTGFDQDDRYYIQSNGSLKINIPGVEGLKVTLTGAVDKYLRKTKRWRTPFYLYTWDGTSYEDDGSTPLLVAGIRGGGPGFQPELNEGFEEQLDINLMSIVSYDKTINDDHTFGIMVGAQKETINNANFGAYRRYYLSSAIDQIFAGADLEKDNSGSAWERARMSYFGRVNYNYKEKYLLEFMWRYDGSYNFPENTRYGFFPGVLAGWTISEEDFWQDNIGAVSYLKIRGSYGEMGNDQIWYDDDYLEYQYYATYGFDSYILNDEVAKSLYETRVPNDQITWEIARNSNIGIEGELLDGLFTFEADYFNNKRTQIPWIRNASIPQTTGLSLPAENIGELQNKGFDFMVGFNKQSGEFTYKISANGSYAKNKILFWDEAPGAPEWQQSTGHPINTGLYYLNDGVFATQAEIDAENLDYNAISNNLRPGDMKYVDYDGNGIIDADDRVRIDKNNVPTFQGGLNASVMWKNFDFSILFQGSAGAQIWVKTESGEIGNYTLERYNNRWSPDNPSSTHPRLDNRDDQYWSSENDYFLRSTDYVRLKNMEIGYNIPSHILSKAKISNLRVYANGLNLLTWDGLDVYDPEAINGNGRYYPQARVLSMGLNLSF
ncbi:SusC/RagA family TonB-linked outer membrane protein [Flammeovirgaceae bacterium SG7u.111]|nr:SusC/RagA family TonB-linked outer membrane protein [Flammeovirgaceae bacterium SG7u.132]WPO36457.1 SusC/RagA family TonB-linked outer membrane protein [Flammeovirgaceae bacterium SG7u.111]